MQCRRLISLGRVVGSAETHRVQLLRRRLDELASGRRSPLLSHPRQLLGGHDTGRGPHYNTDIYTAFVGLPGVKQQAHRSCSLWIRLIAAAWPQAPSCMGAYHHGLTTVFDFEYHRQRRERGRAVQLLVVSSIGQKRASTIPFHTTSAPLAFDDSPAHSSHDSPS